MASNNTKKPPAVNSQEEEQGKSMKMPDGFTAVTPDETDRIWVKPEEGTVIHGRLVGRFARRDANGAYYQVRLSGEYPCRGITGTGDDQKVIDCSKGQVVNVDERSAMAELQKYADSDGVFDVFIAFLEKSKIQGGRTWWRIQCAAKQLKAPSKPIAAYEVRAGRVDDNGVPF